jgi:hydrogenase expression/formation protein HypD
MEASLAKYRDPKAAKALVAQIHEAAPVEPMSLMEVCGGQTHTIYQYRLREMLPTSVRLVSGPGCPVCVTPITYIDQAVALCQIPGVVVFTFGDLVRVPGTRLSLEKARALGGRVREVYSPLDALIYAREHPESQVVFLGIGFETTLPTFSLPLQMAIRENRNNFSVLLSAKRVPPVLDALLRSKAPINGFITPGHVTSIIGANAYSELCERYQVPMVVGGFEPIDLLIAIRDLVRLVAEGKHDNANAYPRAARPQGNIKAQQLFAELYEPCDEELRGLGIIADAGYKLRDCFASFDALRKFDLGKIVSAEPAGCRCGQVLAGTIVPEQCPLFGKRCTPDHSIGACMVSMEGTCNAAYLYRDSHE